MIKGTFEENTNLIPIRTPDGEAFTIAGEVRTELSFEMPVPGFSALVVFHSSPKPEHCDTARRIMKALSDEFKREIDEEKIK